jgi:hypothetical protein
VSRKGYYTDLAEWAARKGYEHLRVDGEMKPTREWPRLDRFHEHTIELPVGTCRVAPEREKEIDRLMGLALDYGRGVLHVAAPDSPKPAAIYSVRRACPQCGRSFPEPDPRLFSFNSRHGWCPKCYGTGLLMSGFDENRLTGYAALPFNSNPYLDEFHEPVQAVGALSPLPGDYAVVLDSGSRAGAGKYTFRYWVNDVTPPVLRLRTASVAAGGPVRVAATDVGAGVYPESIIARLDGDAVRATYRRGVISVATRGLAPGRHTLSLRVSDYQESKNTENVTRILPNTRAITVAFRVRA